MRKEEINIRDPFVVVEDGKYYLYGTRAMNFGRNTGGFDVYVSSDLENWSEPIECFNSEKYQMNRLVNWAPEVHRYKGKYYMFATFTHENGYKGTHSLVSDSLLGPFEPLSKGSLTPVEWEALDGTLFVDDEGVPYLVFCHEHMQIKDGTMCYVRLSDDLSSAVSEVTTMFKASECPWAQAIRNGNFVTDGPYMYTTKTGVLLMIWSSFIDGKYAEMVVRFNEGRLDGKFEHCEPLLDSDGGHGMIFSDEKNIYFTYHTPNKSLSERPEFCVVKDLGDRIEM